MYEPGIAEAHNGYLEVCLGLGLVGLILTAMFLLSSTRRATALLIHDYDWSSLCICILLMAAVHNISESSFDSFQRLLMAMVLVLSVSVPPTTEDRLTYKHADVPKSDFFLKDASFGSSV